MLKSSFCAFIPAALLALSVAACAPEYDPQANFHDMSYDVDMRTGLCYAASGEHGSEDYRFAQVPCTGRVISNLPATKRVFAMRTPG